MVFILLCDFDNNLFIRRITTFVVFNSDDNMNFYDIAIRYANDLGYDSIRIAGKRDGCVYYHYYNKATIEHKLGMPHYVRISDNGETSPVEDFDEIMWASHQEVLLNNLRNSCGLM